MSDQGKKVLGYEPALVCNDEPEQVLDNLRGVSCLLTMMASADIGQHRNIGDAYKVLACIVEASTVRLSQALDI